MLLASSTQVIPAVEVKVPVPFDEALVMNRELHPLPTFLKILFWLKVNEPHTSIIEQFDMLMEAVADKTNKAPLTVKKEPPSKYIEEVLEKVADPATSNPPLRQDCIFPVPVNCKFPVEVTVTFCAIYNVPFTLKSATVTLDDAQ